MPASIECFGLCDCAHPVPITLTATECPMGKVIFVI